MNPEPVHIISLGAGVQSSTMALMATHGLISPKPIAAVFADTMVEPAGVYTWLDWLEKQLDFATVRTSRGNLGSESLRLRVSARSGNTYQRTLIPTFIKKDAGGRGILPRKCTRDFKIDMINKTVKELAHIKRGEKEVKVIQWIGISIDEADRMKPIPQGWGEARWPLIELGMSRQDCLDWMSEHGYPKPPRSACVFCPYHSDAEWLRLKTEEPDEFQKAVEWERCNQEVYAGQSPNLKRGVPFLHDSLVPLDRVVFNLNEGKNRFSNECVGICGV